eukprot:gene30106-2166_t
MLRFEQFGLPVMIPFIWVIARPFLRPYHNRQVEADAEVLRAQIELAYRLHKATLPPGASDVGGKKSGGGGKAAAQRGPPPWPDAPAECGAAAVAAGLSPPPPTMAADVVP